MTDATMTHSMRTTENVGANLIALISAGAVATVAFDFFGQTISPLLGGIVPTLGAKLAPVGLAQASLAAMTGIEGATIGALGLHHAVHLLTGVLFYPLAWALVGAPVAERFAPGLPWWAAAAAFGVGLWIFALYVMAHLVAGMPAFLGFGALTWVALWGHVLFALVLAAMWRRRGG